MSPDFIRRAWRFSVTGVMVTLVHIVVANICILGAGARPAAGNAVAFMVATIVSYWVNTHWSFSSTPNPRLFGRYLVVALVGLGVSAGLAHGVEAMGFSYGFGIAAVVCVMPPLNFLMHHLWTYVEPHRNST